jgi:hypothetical protein
VDPEIDAATFAAPAAKEEQQPEAGD